MEIYVAEHAGFCYGVERAVGMVEKTAEEKENVYTLGPIIHNPQVVENFASKGVEVYDEPEDVSENSTVVIRSHGVPKKTYDSLKNKSADVVDATCPFVKKAQQAAERLSRLDNTVVIFGERDHPEVEGIISYIPGEYYIVSNIEDAEALKDAESYGLIAQTTQNGETFDKIAEILKNKCRSITVENTICNATNRRQGAAVKIAGKVDLMVVIGGKNSANTRRLYNICKDICRNTVHIETADELDTSLFERVEKVGITAGASTPGYLVEEVLEYLEEVKK